MKKVISIMLLGGFAALAVPNESFANGCSMSAQERKEYKAFKEAQKAAAKKKAGTTSKAGSGALVTDTSFTKKLAGFEPRVEFFPGWRSAPEWTKSKLGLDLDVVFDDSPFPKYSPFPKSSPIEHNGSQPKTVATITSPLGVVSVSKRRDVQCAEIKATPLAGCKLHKGWTVSSLDQKNFPLELVPVKDKAPIVLPTVKTLASKIPPIQQYSKVALLINEDKASNAKGDYVFTAPLTRDKKIPSKQKIRAIFVKSFDKGAAKSLLDKMGESMIAIAYGANIKISTLPPITPPPTITDSLIYFTYTPRPTITDSFTYTPPPTKTHSTTYDK